MLPFAVGVCPSPWSRCPDILCNSKRSWPVCPPSITHRRMVLLGFSRKALAGLTNV